MLVTAASTLAAQTPKPTRPERPAAPANFRAVRTGPDEVTLTWDPVDAATAYAIGRLIPPNGWARGPRVPAGTTHYVDRGRDLSSPHTYSLTTIAGPMASEGVRSEVIRDSSPIETGVVNGKVTPPRSTSSNKEPVKGTTNIFVPDPAGCTTSGGYTTCVSPITPLYPAEGEKTATVFCPTGQFALGGGFARDAQAAQAKESRPTSIAGKGERPGWVVTMQRLAMGASADVPETISNWLNVLTPVNFTVYVICAPPR